LQLPLNIRLSDAFCFANFFGDANAEAVTELKNALARLAQPGSTAVESIFLYGLPGTGKTHLLQSACQLARELEVDSVYLPLGQPGLESPQVLEGLGQLSLVCIDDVQLVAGNPEWETALFGLYERLKDHGLLVCASTAAPAETGFAMKDLVSRLQRGLVYGLRGLAHNQKLEVIRQRAKLRGLEITDDVAAYIEKHFPRDMQTLVSLLEQLDEQSLIQQRRITIPFIRSLLEQSAAS